MSCDNIFCYALWHQSMSYCLVISKDILLYHVISCNVLPCPVISACHIISYDIKGYHINWCNKTISHDVILCPVIPQTITTCPVISETVSSAITIYHFMPYNSTAYLITMYQCVHSAAWENIFRDYYNILISISLCIYTWEWQSMVSIDWYTLHTCNEECYK